MNMEENAQPKTLPWIICLIGILYFLYETILKITPYILTDDLKMSFQINNGAKIAWLSTTYCFIYTLLQIPAGSLLDRFGARQLLTVAALLACLGLTLFAGTPHFHFAVLSQLITGIGGSVALVGALFLVSQWLTTQKNRALYLCFVIALSVAGIALQPHLSAFIDEYGWRSTVLLLGIIGGIFSLLFWLFVRNRETETTKAASQSVITNCTMVFKNTKNWLIAIIAALMYAPAVLFAFSFGEHLLKSHYSLLTTSDIAAINLLIFIGWLLGNPVIGACSDLFQRRKLFIAIGAFGLVVCLLSLAYCSALTLMITGLLFFLLGLFSSFSNLSYALIIESNPPTVTGTAIGFLNFIIVGGNLLFFHLFQYRLFT